MYLVFLFVARGDHALILIPVCIVLSVFFELDGNGKVHKRLHEITLGH